MVENTSKTEESLNENINKDRDNIVPIIIIVILSVFGLFTFGELSKRDNIYNYINNELKVKQSLYYELQSGHAGIYAKIADELGAIKDLESKNDKLDKLLDKLKNHNSQEGLQGCIEQLKEANKKITLLILNGTEKQKHTLTGFSSDVECTDKNKDSKNNDSSIYLSLEGSSTYFLSVTLILLASILGAILNHIRRHIPEAKNSTSDNDTEQEIGLSNSYLGAFANGLGAGIVLVLVVSWGGWSFAAIESSVVSGSYLKGIALVVLIGFIAGLFYHRFYEALKKKTDDAANKLSDKEKNKKLDAGG